MAFALRLFARRISMARSISTTPVNMKLTFSEKMDFKEYRQYGLFKDDFWTEADAVVVEALERLPEEKRMQRIYRAIRAQQLYLEKNILPKEEWSTLEDDHEYLMPYLMEIRREINEKDAWERSH